MDIGAEDAGLSVAGPARGMRRKSGCFTRWIRAWADSPSADEYIGRSPVGMRAGLGRPGARPGLNPNGS